jgi:branched-chain amino acid transport system permease protein
MRVSAELLFYALQTGLLLGGFYAAVSVGITIAFGMLDIVNIAHPAFIILGAFVAYYLNSRFGIDPLLASLIAILPAFLVGRLLYKMYYYAFERHGEESLQGLAFFFGILFIVEIGLLLVFGVDYRFVQAVYIQKTFNLGYLSLPLRLVVPLVVGLMMVAAVHLFMSRTFLGRAILAVSQDPGALRLVGGNPIRAKEIAFGVSIVTAVVAGALLIIIQPVEPSMGRDYIGRVFAICVLGGMRSLRGTVLASIIVGIAEAITATFGGPAWAPAVAFGLLMLTLVVRPEGIFQR